MASAEIKIPDLIPGKRYRMVVETTDSDGNITVGTTSVPSIEFLVPSASHLLSNYTPTYSIDVDNYPASGGEIIGYIPDETISSENIVTAYSAARSKICNNSTTISSNGNYLFSFNNLYGAPPVGQTFRVSGMVGSNSIYYDNLLYTAQSHDSVNNKVIAVGKLNGEDGWANQTYATKEKWRNQGGSPFIDLNTTTSVFTPRLSWIQTESDITTSPPANNPQPIYSAIVPSYSRTSVTVSIPSSFILENNIGINGDRVVEIPVFFYIKDGIFYNLDNSVMSGLPPVITAIPVAIPRSGVNTNPNNTNSSEISLRSYRFSVARYTQINGLFSAEWSQVDDAYRLNPLMRNVIYSRTATL